MRFKKREAKRLSLEITPLIDVIFLLLIFFMISTTFISTPRIEVNLPKASAKATSDPPKAIEITITRKHAIFIDGKRIKKEDVQQTLTRRKQKTKQDSLIIRADGQVQHQVVIFVMDAAKKASIHKLSIATRRPPEKRSKHDASTNQ